MFKRLFVWAWAIALAGFAGVYFLESGWVETLAAFAAAGGFLSAIAFGVMAFKFGNYIPT